MSENEFYPNRKHLIAIEKELKQVKNAIYIVGGVAILILIYICIVPYLV